MRLYCFFVFLLLNFVAWAQPSGFSMYNSENFRKCPEFHEEVTLEGFDAETANACLFFAINETRAKRKLPQIPRNYALENAAWNHSRKMGESDFFSHYNTKDRTRKAPSDRARLAGIANPAIAECILHTPVYDYTYLELADYMVKLWMNSPGHRTIIVSKNNIAMGTGIFLVYMKKYDSIRAYGSADFQWFNPVTLSGSPATDKLPYVPWQADKGTTQ